MSLYSEAVETIRDFVSEEQQRLNRAHEEAMIEYERIARELVAEIPVPEISALVANTMSVKREPDGLPQLSIPESTKSVVMSAILSGLWSGITEDSETHVGLDLYRNPSYGIMFSLRAREAYNTWSAKNEYAKKQTVGKL